MSKVKELNMVIKSCGECPFNHMECHYEEDFCNHPKQTGRMQGLYPAEDTYIRDPKKILDNCPLPNKEAEEAAENQEVDDADNSD